MRAIGWIIYFGGIVALSTLAVLPFVATFPPSVGRPGNQYDVTFLLLGVMLIFALGVLAVALRATDDGRKRLMRSIAWAAAISITASVLLALDARVPIVEIPTAHILAPLLQVDGESAYDAGVFEIYCELWLFIAALFGIALLVLRRRKRYLAAN
jgi:hypothetical protein